MNTDPATIAAILMQQKDVPLWSLADSTLIQCIALNLPIKRGKKEFLIFNTLRILKFDIFQHALLITIGITKATHWWWKNGTTSNLKRNRRLFVGFGAGSEDTIWKTYQKKHDETAIKINQAIPGGQQGLVQIRFPEIIQLVFLNSKIVIGSYKNSSDLIKAHRLDFLTIAASQIGVYCYYYAWWSALKKNDPEEVIFLSADTVSHACIAAGIRNVVFKQHGLLKRSIVYPPFSYIQAITQEEVSFLKKILPNSEITFNKVKTAYVCHKDSVILTIHKTMMIEAAKSFIQWAIDKNLKVIIRFHPVDKQELSLDKFTNVTLASNSESYISLLNRERPIFVASWFSTTLAEALINHIIPVTLAHPDSVELKDIIYTFHSHALAWPECREKLEHLIEHPKDYRSVLHTLV